MACQPLPASAYGARLHTEAGASREPVACGGDAFDQSTPCGDAIEPDKVDPYDLRQRPLRSAGLTKTGINLCRRPDGQSAMPGTTPGGLGVRLPDVGGLPVLVAAGRWLSW
jgi:hypothetical protein